jgi:hypothetical protein
MEFHSCSATPFSVANQSMICFHASADAPRAAVISFGVGWVVLPINAFWNSTFFLSVQV